MIFHPIRLTFCCFLALVFCFTKQNFAQETLNMRIDEQENLLVFYPNFSTLDLVCGKCVPAGDDILFCGAAAFTAKCLKYFCHDNIRCNHVSNGQLFKGSAEPICNGVFTYYNGKGHFAMANQADLEKAAQNHGMGFCQVIVILNHKVMYANEQKKTFWIKKDYVFRALCEKDGRLCIAESKEAVSYAQFVSYLVDYGFDNAINLDMGGWSHSSYRSNSNKRVTTNAIPTRFASNWIVFKK